MKVIFRLAQISLLFAFAIGCSRNAPGTMGGGGIGIPETVATGAAKYWAEETPWTDSHTPAILLEHSATSFGDPASTNARSLTLSEALQLRAERLKK